MAVLPTLLALRTFAALQGLEPWAEHAEEDPVLVEPSEVTYVQARYTETVIRGRPWVPHKRVATIKKGTRLGVRGIVQSRDKEGCKGKEWYAVLPFGYVCSTHVTDTDEAPSLEAALPVATGRRLPHAYAMIKSDGIPEYASAEDAELDAVARDLTRGMSLVVARSVEIGGVSYVVSSQGKYVPKAGISWMGQGSDWQGVYIEDALADTKGPLFAWSTGKKKKVQVYAEPTTGATKVRQLAGRERVALLEPDHPGPRPRWWKIAEGEWVEADRLNEVHAIAIPRGVLTEFRTETSGNDQWIDVDVGEQVLVAYRGETPVYTTLISSGRGSPTPLGNYPIWAKVASMDMSNQDYEDKPYMVQGVPWVLLFQGHNALHGAYWHDRFGERKSHGCVNLAPLDARWVFEWAGPMLPEGWTGYLPSDLQKSVTVHVRDSSKDVGSTFTQQRPIGPPNREEERKKLERAEQRRALAAGPVGDDPTDPFGPDPGERAPRLTPPPMQRL